MPAEEPNAMLEKLLASQKRVHELQVNPAKISD